VKRKITGWQDEQDGRIKDSRLSEKGVKIAAFPRYGHIELDGEVSCTLTFVSQSSFSRNPEPSSRMTSMQHPMISGQLRVWKLLISYPVHPAILLFLFKK